MVHFNIYPVIFTKGVEELIFTSNRFAAEAF